MTGIEWLRTLHTKQLIELKNRCYESILRFGYGRQGDITFTHEELKKYSAKDLIFRTERKLI